MSNTLLYYDPIFYAQEALIHLEKNLGLSTRVHRGYDKAPQQKGSTINISRPATFSAQAAPGSDMALTATGVSIVLDKWYEVKFALTDKELSFTQEQIIADHIAPAAYALADQVDQDLAALYKDVYWKHGAAGATPDGVDDLTGVKKVLREANVPFDGRTYLMIGPAVEDKFGQLAAFYTASTVGDQGRALRTGDFGVKYGFEIFTNQNAPSHTKGTLAAGAALAVNGIHAAGVTEVALKDNDGAPSLTGTLLKGDIITITGDSQPYVITENATAAENAITAKISPALVEATSGNEAVALVANHAVNLGFHRNAFALATAPLSEMGNDLGAKIATVTRNGLALRSRIWYAGDSSAVKVGLDILYGVKTLDARMAVRLLG